MPVDKPIGELLLVTIAALGRLVVDDDIGIVDGDKARKAPANALLGVAHH
jgi:hypothetical protein